MNKNIKIAYITASDPNDRRTWSGTTYYIKKALMKHVGNIFDIAIAPVSSIELAYVETKIPIIYISDATFPLVHKTYNFFNSLPDRSIKNEQFYERSTLGKSTLLIYSSSWAATSAENDYGIDKKIHPCHPIWRQHRSYAESF